MKRIAAIWHGLKKQKKNNNNDKEEHTALKM